MSTPFKKLLLVLITMLSGVMNSGVSAQSVTQVSSNEYAYFDGSTTTNYDLSISSYSGTNTAQVTTNNPWWTGVANSSVADLFATAVQGNLGYPNYGYAPVFQYNSPGGSAYNGSSLSQFPGLALDTSYTYAVATVHGGGGAVAPEMNASFIPQVALMLACLFFLLGRKKEVAVPMLVV